MNPENEEVGLEWQIGVWDKMSELYAQDIDRRFVPVIDGILTRARLEAGERVLDLGTGTGSLALHSATSVGKDGRVVAVDISPEMLEIAERRAGEAGLVNIEFREGRAEAIPCDDASIDVVLASLSLMYVIDRDAAALEIARVLSPGGRFVASVWGAADECDIVRFQQTAGSFAPKPPVAGVGPGALADTGEFIGQLSRAGIIAHVEREETAFEFDSFDLAWDVLAGVTTAQLPPETREQAREAVRDLVWHGAEESRRFRNMTQYVIGRR